MPFVRSDGVRIWYEVVGSGRPLVLLHGGAADGSAWREAGYVARLQSDFRLILIDQRGAGRSDKPYASEAYLVDRLAADTLAVLADLEVGSFIVWGWSWGGDPVYELARRLPDRVAAAVVTGNRPGPMSAEGLQWIDDNLVKPVRARGMEAILELAFEWEGDSLPEWTRRQILETDPDAFVATALGNSLYPSLSEGELAALSVPTLMILGEREDPDHESERKARLMPQGSAAVLPGLGHVAAFDRSDLTVPIFGLFLDQAGDPSRFRPSPVSAD